MAGLVSSETIGPGQSGQIEVTLDPAGKFGHIIKTVTITSNNLTQPVVEVPVYATVIHGVDAGESEPIEDVLFGREECAECHADPATGLSGVVLYDAVCAMCHGSISDYAAALPAEIRSLDALRTWTAQGDGAVGMPGYATDKGGPLTDEQIESLVQALLTAGEQSP